MSWGYKIIAVYATFVVGIMLLVFKSSNQQVDLVTQDYYAKELKYQDQIDAIKRTEALSAPLKQTVSKEQLTITLPEEFKGKQVNATVTFYCPSDKARDVVRAISCNNGELNAALPVNSKGHFNVQVSWVCEAKSYYFENKLFL